MATKKIQVLSTDLLSHIGTISAGEIKWVTLSADAWEGAGEGDLYRQFIDLDNIKSNCKVDISIPLDNGYYDSELRGCRFCVKNSNGELWVYCDSYYIDSESVEDIDVQLFITTVATSSPDPIWGNTFTFM